MGYLCRNLGTPNVSDWVTTVVGAIGTLVLGCISSIIVRGVAVDGEVSDDGTSEWPIPYVSLLRDSVYDVPFPEPWLFRILCTNQVSYFSHYNSFPMFYLTSELPFPVENELPSDLCEEGQGGENARWKRTQK